MFKKFSTAILLATVVLFGGALSTVGAAANEGNQLQGTDIYKKVYFSVNGQWGNWQDLNDYFDTYLQNWNHTGSAKKDQQNHTEQKDEVVDQPTSEEVEVQQQQPTERAPEQTENNEQAEQLGQFEQQVVELTNNERTKQGLAPLEADAELSKVAREKSKDMATNSYFDHNSPTHGSPFDMMKSYGVSYTAAGENIAKGQQTPEEVVNGWMNSQGHRENILSNDFTHIGVGYVEQGNHWTQMFIKK